MVVTKVYKPRQARAMSPVSSKKAKDTIQRFQMGPSRYRTVNLVGMRENCNFNECVYNSVEYRIGDIRRNGTMTQSPAAWNRWIKNTTGGNNATQLHVVNRRWGGLGGREQNNIIPGSPTLNSNHYNQAEKFFDTYCFGNFGNVALHNCRYECFATPNYANNLNVTNIQMRCNDPNIKVTITDLDTQEQNLIHVDNGTNIFIKDECLPIKNTL